MGLRYGGKIVNQEPVSIVKRYYGGKMVDDYSAMRGPCPVGFHVPSKDEWVAITTVWTYLGGGNNDGTNFGVAFKLPFAGTRIYSSAEVSDQGTKAFYWSYTKYSTNSAYYFRAGSTSFGTNYAYYRAHGLSLRPFKDSPIIPTSSWTKLYGTSIEAGGIFWDSTSGLISASANGQTWITIADKNLGATTVWNSGDTLSEANCGGYFQWGNNYMFPFAGTVTTSSTQVDASNYGPGNYYESSTFIIGSGDWSSVHNNNLRGGDTGVQQRPAEVMKMYYGGKMINNYSAIQGPAPDGFHIPLGSELQDLVDMMNSIGISSDTQGSSYSEYLKIPLAGFRSGVNSNVRETGLAFLWSSSHRGEIFASCLILIPGLGEYEADFTDKWRNDGYSLRCFKDTPVVPDNSWTNLYGTNTAGIFHNATLGLISIVNGDDIITIADKNLGATTVWNAGDTLTSNNCGNYYQRGNNYGFPFTGTVTTSSTKVDASNYGPGNYYSSSTFIIDSEDGRWSSVPNNNLWGGVTGVQQRPALIREKP